MPEIRGYSQSVSQIGLLYMNLRRVEQFEKHNHGIISDVTCWKVSK